MRTLTRRLPVLFVFILLLFVLPPATRADEIVITNGSLTMRSDYATPTYSFGNPAQGFNISGGGGPGQGNGGYIALCYRCKDDVTIRAHTGRFDTWGLGFGPATVGGVNYERLHYTGAIFFSTPSFTIQNLSPSFTIDVPFTMTGNLMGSMGSGGQPPVIFTTTFSGHGTASFLFNSYLYTHGGWLHDLQSVTFNFSPDPAPVPEPATLILLGTGLAAVATRYRRRRRS
jgi:hypothetical protein